MIPLMTCEACSRHVRVTESRCPFCGAPREPEGPSSLPPLARPMSRAVIAALGASLSLAACRARTSGAAETVSVEPPREPPHTTIVAPYGAPPDPTPRPREASWLVTLPDPIRMAARASTPLEVSATNPYDTPVPSHRERVTMRVNGAAAPAFDRVFQQGDGGTVWGTVPAGAAARAQFMILEALMPSPGEYFVELYLDGRRIAGRRITVVP